MVTKEAMLQPAPISMDIASGKPAREAVVPDVTSNAAPASISLDDRLRELEATLITWALKMSHGNKSRAAELLQIKRSTLGDRIRHCGLGPVAPASVHDARDVAMAAR